MYWDKCSRPCVLSLRGDEGWPDSNIRDLFLWIYFNENFVQNCPHTQPELRVRIIGELNVIFVMKQFKSLDTVFNRILMLTATILGTLFFEQDESKTGFNWSVVQLETQIISRNCQNCSMYFLLDYIAP